MFRLSYRCIVVLILFPLLYSACSATTSKGRDSTATYFQSKQTKSIGSTVYGRAVYSDTERPVDHALIELRSITSYGPEQISSTTNGRGEFRIDGVPSGRYFIGVNSSAVVSTECFLNHDEERDTVFYLDEMREYFEEVEVDGKTDKQVLVRARRGAAISGKVTYANRDAAIDHPVTILRRRGNRYSMFWTNLRTMRAALITDDRGMFRVTGLPAGEYIVGATPMLEHGELVKDESLEANMVGSMLAMIFHPSTALVTQTTTVRLRPGEERGGVDITIPEREMHRVSGVVRGRDDHRPVADARVRIIRKETHENVTRDLFWPYSEGMPGVQTDALGRWRLAQVPDGRYIIFVQPPADNELPPGAKRYGGTRQEIDVAGGDVNVTIELGRDSTVAGTVTVENTRTPPSIYLGLQTLGMNAGVLASGTVQGGGFTIRNVPPGEMYFFVNLEGNIERLYLKSITLKGKDLLREPLEVGSETNIEGVEIVLSPEVATFNIRVRTSRGEPVSEVSMTLVPSDAARWDRKEAQLFGTTDTNGRCTIIGAPGEYLVFILPSGVRGSTLQKSEIEQRAAGVQRVSLRPGERRAFDVVISGNN